MDRNAEPAGSLESFEAVQQIARDLQAMTSTTQPSVSVGALSAIKPSDGRTDARCFGRIVVVERRLGTSHRGAACTVSRWVISSSFMLVQPFQRERKSDAASHLGCLGGAFGGTQL